MSENMNLRKLLWLHHGCSQDGLYGDDGEMQCNKCRIDFRRDSAKEIEAGLSGGERCGVCFRMFPKWQLTRDKVDLYMMVCDSCKEELKSL